MTSPIVTFLTDFGAVDEYVGCMKGAVLQRCRDAQLVDLTHGIEPGDVQRGALALAAAVPYFPAGTIHVAVIDPGVGSDRASLVVDCGEFTLVGPDNGLLSVAMTAGASAYVLDREEFHASEVSPTFHGRDVFAPVAGHLAAGRAAHELGSAVSDIVAIALPRVVSTDDGIVGEVLYADRFGNLVTSLLRDDLSAAGSHLRVVVGDCTVGPLRSTYSDARKGELVAVIGSTGRVEIAVVDGSAQARFGRRADPGTRVQVLFEAV